MTTIQVPFQRLRVGFFVSDAFELEPAGGLNFVDVGGESLTQLSVEAAGLYHFTTDPARARAYLKAGGGLNLIDVGDASDTQFGIGGGVGVKLPVADQLAVRLEADFTHAFESDDRVGSNNIAVLIGFSFFTR